MKKLLLMGMLILAPLFAEKFDPVVYQAEMHQKFIEEDKVFKKNLRLLIPECKARIARFKKYKEFAEANPQINQELSQSIIKSCEARVVSVCGAIMSAGGR